VDARGLAFSKRAGHAICEDKREEKMYSTRTPSPPPGEAMPTLKKREKARGGGGSNLESRRQGQTRKEFFRAYNDKKEATKGPCAPPRRLGLSLLHRRKKLRAPRREGALDQSAYTGTREGEDHESTPTKRAKPTLIHFGKGRRPLLRKKMKKGEGAAWRKERELEVAEENEYQRSSSYYPRAGKGGTDLLHAEKKRISRRKRKLVYCVRKLW